MKMPGKIAFAFGMILSLAGCTTKTADTPCVTTGIKYSVDVVNILSFNCYTCHAGSAQLGGGFVLDNYTDLKAVINTGQLLKSINHQSGASPMPKNAAKLSSCNIAIITAWVNNGAPNN